MNENEAMMLATALQTCDGDIRVSHGWKWLYGDEDTSEWVVLSRGYHAKKNTEHYRGSSLGDAVTELIKD